MRQPSLMHVPFFQRAGKSRSLNVSFRIDHSPPDVFGDYVFLPIVKL